MKSDTERYYAWAVLILLIALYTSSFIDRAIFGPLVGPIRTDLQITDTEIGLLAGFAFAFAYTLAGLPMGWIVDNGSRRVLIAAGCAVWSIMTALCGVANSFGMLFIARLGVGIGQSVLSPAAYALLGELFPKEKLGRALSYYSLGIPIGTGLALIIGGSLPNYFADVLPDLPLIGTPKPWQNVFIVIGLPGLVLALLTPFIVRDPQRTAPEPHPGSPHPRQPSASFATVLRFMWHHKGVYGLVIGSVTANAIASYAAITWMPAYLERIHSFSPAHVASFLGLSTLVLGVPGMVLAGSLADRLIKRGRGDGHLLVGIVYVAGVYICGFLPPIIPNPTVSLFLMANVGFFMFTWVGAATALLVILTPAHMRGQVSAIYIFCTGTFGTAIGPAAVGIVTDYVFGYDAAVGDSLFLVGGIAMSMAVAMLSSARSYVPRAAADLKALAMP